MEKSGRLFHPAANNSKRKPSGGRSGQTQLVQQRYTIRNEGVGRSWPVLYTRDSRFAGNPACAGFCLLGGVLALSPVKRKDLGCKLLSGTKRWIQPSSRKGSLHCMPKALVVSA